MNYRIEYLKIISAVMVVFIHTTAFIYVSGENTFWNYHVYRETMELAVPFFFMASGYILAIKSKEYGLKYALNLFAIYVSATLFYCCYKIGVAWMDSLVLNQDFITSLTNEYAKLDLTKFVNGTIGQFHLWYLASTVVGVLLIYLLKKWNRNSIEVLAISLTFYVLSLTNFIDFKGLIMYGGFPKAMFYMALGLFVTEMNKEKMKAPLLKMLVFIVLYTILRSLSYTNISELLLMLSSFYLFVFATKKTGKKTKWVTLSQYTLSVYILHVFIYSACYKVLQYKGYSEHFIQNNSLHLFLFNVGTILICVLLHKPLQKLFFKPIEEAIKQAFETSKKKRND